MNAIWFEKCLKFRPKMTKIPEFSDFWKFHAIFVSFFEWLGGLKCQRRRKRKKSLPQRLLWKYKSNFCWKNCIKFWPKLSKNLENFKNFMRCLSIFRNNWWLRMSKTFNKENCCPGVFFEDAKAVCAGKMHQIHTKIDKKIKKFGVSKILINCCVFFWKLSGLETHRRSTRKQVVVRGTFWRSKSNLCRKNALNSHQNWTKN